MTASEFIFLAMGLALGLASGAALIEVLRARPPAPREVRVTVAQDAIPRRRSVTLADDAFIPAGDDPARGGPAEVVEGDPSAVGEGGGRTPVRPAAVASVASVAIRAGEPTDVTGDGPRPGVLMEPVFRLADPATPTGGAAMVGVPVESEADPMLSALRASAAASAVAAMRASGAPAPSAVAVASASGGDQTDTGDLASLAAAGATGPVGGAAANPAAGGQCADERRLADERCELATRARAQAGVAEDTLRAAQRSYDEHEALADQAAVTADPRAVRRAKDEAQARFRAGRAGSSTIEGVEGAARAWLAEINEINSRAREAAIVTVREREAARLIGANLERTALEAEAARIAAETAEAACLAAREAVADCEERATIGQRPGTQPVIPSGAPDDELDAEAPLAAALGRSGSARIFRLLHGDRVVQAELVALLAGDDEAERRRWQSGLSDLVDAILADSIEASVLDFPEDHPFWGPFTLAQDREIAEALSSLGYRFDGRGGWVDGRYPSQRDLSLALGYAGLDPMRMRQWPNEREMTELYAGVTVAADEHLVGNAGDLTLGELVTMLGRRADGLAEVWNDWGRLRPLLVEEV